MWDLMFLISGLLCILQKAGFYKSLGSTFILIALFGILNLFPQDATYYIYSLILLSFPLFMYKDRHINNLRSVYTLIITLLFFIWEVINCILFISDTPEIPLNIVYAVDSILLASIITTNTKGGISGLHRYITKLRRLPIAHHYRYFTRW